MPILSRARFLGAFLQAGPTANLADLRDTRSGHCYIVADGTSTRFVAPSHLEGEEIIAVGAVPSIEGFVMDPKSFWVFPEPEVLLSKTVAQILGIVARRSFRPPAPFATWRQFAHFSKGFGQVAQLCKESTLVVHLTHYLSVSSNYRRYTIFRSLPKGLEDLGINDPFRGSLNSALTLAAILGYSEVRLLGFDYLLDPPMSGHWYESRPSVVTPELKGFYQDFLKQFRDTIQVKHVLLPGQSSQIESIQYETDLGTPLIVPNTMKQSVKQELMQSEMLPF
jgi:hypothetical protein